MPKKIEPMTVKTVMRDGMELGAELYLPEGEGPFPTIVERTARYKERSFLNPLFDFLAQNGFAVLSQNAADRWVADRDVRPFFSHDWTDAEDGYDTIEWAAAQDWSNGDVGGIGYSYPAWCQWVLAAQRPPHLKTLFVGGMTPRTTDWQLGGVYRIGRQLQWTIGPMAIATQQYLDEPQGPETQDAYWNQKTHVDREKWLWYLPQKELPLEMLGGMKDRFTEWLDNCHVDRWKLHENFSKIDIPVFHRTSWYDRLARNVEMFTGMQTQAPSQSTRDAQRMVIGPWSHIGQHEMPRKVGDVDFGPEAEADVFDWALPWFNHWLKGEENGFMDTAPVRLFIMGANTWRDEQTWPLERETRTEFFLHSNGKANTPNGDGLLSLDRPQEETSDKYDYDPRDPVMTLYAFGTQDEPHDRRVLDHRRDVLVYQTPPLKKAIEVTGVPEVVVFIASSAPDTDFTVKLIDVAPDGFSQEVCYGIVRCRFRDGFDEPKLMEPGQTYRLKIEMMPTSNLFRAGHRIRLDISSSDFPNFDRNHNTGGDDYGESTLVTAHQTVFHDTKHLSRIVLPVIAD